MTRDEFRDFSPEDLSILKRIACGEVITFKGFYGGYLSRHRRESDE